MWEAQLPKIEIPLFLEERKSKISRGYCRVERPENKQAQTKADRYWAEEDVSS